MLGDWADDDDDDGFSHFAGLGARKSQSHKGKSSSSGSSGAFMFVSSGVYDLASGKKENEEKNESSAMQVDNAAPEAPAPASSAPKKQKAAPKDEDLGKWERYTKGVGSKMLKKMGWTGRGLGADESGIIVPIKAVARTQGGGLAETDYMGVQKSSWRQTEEQEEARPEPKEEEQRKGLWKKDAQKDSQQPSKPKAPKIVYKTREEYEREYGTAAKASSIIDMRGPSETEPEAASAEPKALGSQFMRELRHNLSHLVDLRVNNIHSIIRKKHFAESELKNLKGEEATLKHAIEGHQSDISHLQALKERLETMRMHKNDVDFDMINAFEELKDVFPTEYKLYRLESLVFHYVFPRIEKEFKTWRPLQNPTEGIETVKKWKVALRSEDEEEDDMIGSGYGVYDDGFGVSSRLRMQQVRQSIHNLDTFNRLAYEVVVPKMRSALSSWDVYDPDPALDLLYAWKPVLPRIAYNYLLYHVVEKRIKSAVDEFDPKKSKSQSMLPMDTWVLPWVPIFGISQISTLLEDIRRKLQASVSVAGLLAIDGVKLLSPWKGVLDDHNWAQLMARSVLSKIESLLRNVEIDPSEQKMEEFNEAFAWSSLVSNEALGIALLESGFWKRWFYTLGLWLHQEDVEFEQVQSWYSSWKQRFPKPLQTTPQVQPQFRSALKLMFAAAEGQVPPMEEFVPSKPLKRDPAAVEAQDAAKDKQKGAQRPVWQDASLKELLEEAADDAGTLFMATGRKQDGNAVFTFGNIPVYLERDLIMAQLKNGDPWQPISISELIEQASS